MGNDEIAILMAAGLGTRMLPLTNKIPKPLAKVHDVPLIETIILGLEKRGVCKIYIVVGHLKTQFYYLSKKFDNVEIVENKEYLNKNNISSLYAVKEVLGSADCFICEADLYISNQEIFNKISNHSCYFGKRVCGYSNDWLFTLKNDRIIKIGKGGENCYNMAGVSYWKKEDSGRIKEGIECAYKEKNHEQLFWDEIVDRLLDKIEVFVSEVTANDIVEIDTVEELKLVNDR